MAVLDLSPDPVLVERNKKRAEELKKRMGTNYLCHPDNRVQRLKSHVNLAQIGSVLTQPKGSGR